MLFGFDGATRINCVYMQSGSSLEAAAVHCRARAAASSSASLLLRNVAQSAAACGCKMKKVATAEMRRVESSSMDAVDVEHL